MNAQGHFLILSVLVVPLCLALLGCKREPPAVAALPPPVVTLSQGGAIQVMLARKRTLTSWIIRAFLQHASRRVLPGSHYQN